VSKASPSLDRIRKSMKVGSDLTLAVECHDLRRQSFPSPAPPGRDRTQAQLHTGRATDAHGHRLFGTQGQSSKEGLKAQRSQSLAPMNKSGDGLRATKAIGDVGRSKGTGTLLSPPQGSISLPTEAPVRSGGWGSSLVPSPFLRPNSPVVSGKRVRGAQDHTLCRGVG
jgi:hypothetical protein